ncbi:hypothetical protein FSP39_023471 [Pinctada imbricata]|uniref:Uncharacterized protein n=1 Tax=Pinctada imbricata TaxID=66713 RepID=A0AA88YKB0_PINIB|nr:hypothetical protein FSP39_023471 [Pinctada imbricata]
MTEESILVLWTCRKNAARKPETRYSTMLRSEITTDKHAGCLSPNGTIQLLPTTYLSWDIVDEACLKLTGMPVATHINERHCEKFAENITSIFTDEAFITGNRTYHSIISIADISASGIPFNHILCKTFTWNGTFNLTEGNSSKLVRCTDGKKNFLCIKGIHQEAISTSSVLIVITLVASLLTIVVCIFMFIICYKRRCPSKLRSRKNEKTEGKTSARTTSDEQYNHTVSNGRISTATENKADKGESEDSEADSDFSSDCVNSESETLNKGNVTPRLQLQYLMTVVTTHTRRRVNIHH